MVGWSNGLVCWHLTSGVLVSGLWSLVSGLWSLGHPPHYLGGASETQPAVARLARGANSLRPAELGPRPLP